MPSPVRNKHIVLGICGGIAAYKSVTLLRLLVKNGAEVQVVMTPAGREFITPVTLSSLSRRPVVSEFFTANTGEWHSHVDLGLWADLMVVAPCTASTMGKMAHGIADNMLVTTYLSAREPVMIAPAMDFDMYLHSTTQRNLRQLAADGVMMVEAASGELASGLTGKGRMAEPEEIFHRIEEFFGKSQDLAGKKAVVTAGPTYERLDPVRFIGNFSSGKMGFAIADELASRGAEVTLVTGPVDLKTDNSAIRRVDVESALQMCGAATHAFAEADIAVFAAAVADYRPETCADCKIKREGVETQTLRLVRNPDVAATCGDMKRPGQFTVGFALETDDGVASAHRKLAAKNLDMVVLNTLQDAGAGFRTDTNRITVFTKNSENSYPLKDKRAVAVDIVDEIVKNYCKE